MPGARRIASVTPSPRRPFAQPILGGDATLARAASARGAARDSAMRAPRAIAVHARRRNVDESLWYASRPRERREQVLRARIVAAFAGRRREMQHRERATRDRRAQRARSRRDRPRSARCRAPRSFGASSRLRISPSSRTRPRSNVAARSATSPQPIRRTRSTFDARAFVETARNAIARAPCRKSL